MSVPANRWHGHVCSTLLRTGKLGMRPNNSSDGDGHDGKGEPGRAIGAAGGQGRVVLRGRSSGAAERLVEDGVLRLRGVAAGDQPGAVRALCRRPSVSRRRQRHRQYDHLLCARCQELSHGKMIPGVEDFAQKMVGLGDELELLTPQQLRDELGSRVKKSRSLVVLLVDLLDFSGTMLSNSIRDLMGATRSSPWGPRWTCSRSRRRP